MVRRRCKIIFACHVDIFGVLTMNAIKWKSALYIILGLTTLVSVTNWFISGQQFTVKFVIDCFSKSVTLITIVVGLFCSHLWKLKWFQKWLVLIPNLNGKWTGYICSNWINKETGEKIPPIFTTLNIKQSLFKTSCVIQTGESKSHSILSSFWIDEDNQILKLTYTYRNEPDLNIQDRSRMHYGTVILDINIRNGGYVLEGSYWTSRNTCGQLAFSCQEKPRKK